MAEPGKETAATLPPLPQTAPDVPATVAEPSLETVTPVSASQDTETAGGGAAATLDSAQPKAESAHQPPPPPPPETAAVAAVGAPEQTTTEADAQPPVATMPQKVPASAETPAQESAPPAAPTPPSPLPQKQEGGVPELASSVHEEKDASKAREGEGEDKPARRRWRCLRAAVCLLFLRPKTKSGETKPATPPGDKQPASGLEEEEKPTAGEMPPTQKDSGSAVRVPSKAEAGKGEGETKPAALDGKRPEAGQEQVATLPPPAEKSSQETTATAAAAAAGAEAEKQLAAPAPQQQEGGAPEQAPSIQEEKDAAPAPAARRRWRWLQAAVRLLFLRPKGGETKPPTPGDTETALPADSAGKAAAEKAEGEMEPSSAQDGKKPASSGQEEQKPGAARKVKDDGEESKGRRDETQAGKTTTPHHPSLKKFRKAGRLVQFITSLYNKHRSQQPPEEKKKPETASASGPGGDQDSKAKPEPEEKQPASVPKEKTPPASMPEEEEKKTQQHRNWARVEVRLEHILEEAFTRLVVAEYNRELSGVRQRCLLTFSVFDLAAEVKKQAMIYWWVAEFNLPHRRSDPPPPAAGRGRMDDDAEGIFFMLSDHGFLVPMKNWCSKAIHGCQVNPLVHWMLKRQARGDRFAELDDKGSPADVQLSSSILCLTAGNRPLLQKMRMKDESQPQARNLKDESSRPQSQAGRKSNKVTEEPSLQGKSNNLVPDQQRPTTKGDEAQVGSKSMAAADKAPSNKKDEDPTQAKAKEDQLTKDQQQQTTKDEAQGGSKSLAVVNKAPSQKAEDPTQAKEQLPKGAQSIKPSSEPEPEHHLFEGKRVILNVNAHVYPISRSAFLHLAECLVVLQLGRWNNLDDKTYMEVDGLDSRDAIGLLKNLRYLGLRGLSRLTELPKGIESLKKLVILDMRGCQNLVKVEASDNFIKQKINPKKSVITQLKQLTHLDLTECYMLEHIGRGITSLTELQVFKGFVFATGTQGNKACRIQDLKRLKKLQKLTVSITTDANVAEGEMADLKDITSLRKLTITWSEIPSILEGEKAKKKRYELVKRWTSFQLPKDLIKLDIRCYPKEELKLKWHEKLEKLYLRGGDMERFSTEKSNSIKTLRLRYLKKFTMEWKDIRSELQNIEYVEIVITNKDETQEKDKSEVTKDIEDEEVHTKMKIPKFTLDRHGVWTKDEKEEVNKKFLARDKGAIGSNKVLKMLSTITSGNNDGDKAATNEQPKKNE